MRPTIALIQNVSPAVRVSAYWKRITYQRMTKCGLMTGGGRHSPGNIGSQPTTSRKRLHEHLELCV